MASSQQRYSSPFRPTRHEDQESTSPPPSPGRTSTGNYLRSNFSASPTRAPQEVFVLKDEGKGTPAWMQRLLEQKKAEYRARWGELPKEDGDEEETSNNINGSSNSNGHDNNVGRTSSATAPTPVRQNTSRPLPEEEKVPEMVEQDRVTEDIVYEEEYEEEVIMTDDDDEYTTEVITTDDDYTYEEIVEEEVVTDDDEIPSVKQLASQKAAENLRQQQQQQQHPARRWEPKPTPTRLDETSLSSDPPIPIQAFVPTNQHAKRTSNAVPQQTQLQPQQQQHRQTLSSEKTAVDVNPNQQPEKATKGVGGQTPPKRPPPRRQKRPTSSGAPQEMQAPLMQSQSETPHQPLRENSRSESPQRMSNTNKGSPPISPKRVQFSTPSPPSPIPAASPVPPVPAPAQPQPLKSDEDSLYDYVIEIETVSTPADGTSSVYEIEYEDNSTIPSRHDPKEAPLPPGKGDLDVEVPTQAQQIKPGRRQNQKSWYRLFLFCFGCCGVTLFILAAGLAAGMIFAEDEMGFLPFVNDDNNGEPNSRDSGVDRTALPTAGPTRSPTTAPATIQRPSPAPVGRPRPNPPTSPSIPTISATAPTILPTISPTINPTAAPTRRPVQAPTQAPVAAPVPDPDPTASPTRRATIPPTTAPTMRPTPQPTLLPTTAPSVSPTSSPTSTPVEEPTGEWTLISGPFTGTVTNTGYGGSLTMDGNVMAVGAPGFASTGIVQTFSRSSNTGEWQLLNSLFPSASAQDFGSAIDVSVGTQRVAMVVGAPTSFDTQGLNLRFGAAFYYELNGSLWAQRGGRMAPELNPLTANGLFGNSVTVAADARRVAVGAPSISLGSEDIDNGQVFVYDFGDSTMNLVATLSGPEERDLFGSAVALSSNGNRLLIGAPGETGAKSGAIYYYNFDGSNWRLILPLPGTSGTENLGTSVAILADDGNTIAMGAPNFDGGRGLVLVYQTTGSFWTRVGNAITGNVGDLLGTTLAAGPNNRVVAGTANGRFRVYELNSSNLWTPVGSNEPPLGAGVQSIAANTNGDVAVGLSDESVAVYVL